MGKFIVALIFTALQSGGLIHADDSIAVNAIGDSLVKVSCEFQYTSADGSKVDSVETRRFRKDDGTIRCESIPVGKRLGFEVCSGANIAILSNGETNPIVALMIFDKQVGGPVEHGGGVSVSPKSPAHGFYKVSNSEERLYVSCASEPS